MFKIIQDIFAAATAGRILDSRAQAVLPKIMHDDLLAMAPDWSAADLLGSDARLAHCSNCSAGQAAPHQALDRARDL
jgi:hypothetical protein